MVKKEQGGIKKIQYYLFSMFTVYFFLKAISFEMLKKDMNPKRMNFSFPWNLTSTPIMGLKTDFDYVSPF